MSIVVSSEESQIGTRLIGGGPSSGSALHTPSQIAAAARATGPGMLRFGGSTPRVRTSSLTNSLKTTGSPSVTK
jgi:hypothetical protein